MKRIIDWLGGGGSSRAAGAGLSRPGVELDTVGEFLRHFPIGARVFYFPEYQRSVKLDTIVLGYDINGQLIFSDYSVKLDHSGGSASLSLRLPEGVQQLASVDRFRFLVPFKGRSELDYADGDAGTLDTLTEKNVNDFKRGNSITLFNKGTNGKVPYLDSTVVRVIDLREGVYANRSVAVLEPDIRTMQFLDQRQYHRVYTRIPASLSGDSDAAGFPCSIQDFSDRYLRVLADTVQPGLGEAREGARLFVTILVPGRDEPIRLMGTLHRRGEAYLVIALSAVYKQRRFQDMDLIDELDLKTTLLHHPETRRTLAEEAEPDG